MSVDNVDVDEYLAIIGLRPKGTRGRLSEICKQAVEIAIEVGMTFSNWDQVNRCIVREVAPSRKAKTPVASTPEKPQVVRGANAMKIIDADGVETILDVHYKCGKAISYCRCRVVDAPAYYGDVKVELVIV